MRHLAPGNALLAGFEYRYDRNSNRTSQRRTHHLAPGGGGAMGELYAYDSIDRLTGFQERFLTLDHLPTGQPPVDGQTWDLDALGNWASFTRRGVAYRNTPNNNNEYDEPQSGGTRVDDGVPDDFGDVVSTPLPDGMNLAHDKNGSRTADEMRYFHDDLERLVRVERIADGLTVGIYRHDALGRRDRREVLNSGALDGVVRTLHWGGAEVEERDSAGALTRTIVHGHGGGGSGGLWHVLSDGSVGYLLEDALGSTVAMSAGSAAALTERVTYDPYGKPTFESPGNVALVDVTGLPVAASPAGNPHLFAGLRYDPEAGHRSATPAADRAGLYRTLSRSFSPDEGRFLTRDPHGAWSDSASGGNAYTYAGGNPINWTDPSGHVGETITAQYNPKEVGLDKSVPWQKSASYNPKEVGVDKSVPWQKARNAAREYTITKATPWKHHDIQGLDAPTLEFTNGEPYRCQFELFFDRYEEGRSARHVYQHNQTDLQFLSALTPPIRHEHVYQHNQTDLEFVSGKASGSHVYQHSQTDWEFVQTSLKSFSPRMSTADQVSQVIVRGWDPKKKAAILGHARNLPLIGSISVGRAVAPASAVIDYFGQRSNPFPFTKN